MKRKLLELMLLLISLCGTNFTSTALAASGSPSPVYQFDVWGVTSANYNPVLPSPLNEVTALLNLNWDHGNSYGSAFNSSSWLHGGGWLAFVTETWGYPYNGLPATVTYNNAGVTYFATYKVLDSSKVVIGYADEYYCACNSNAFFRASTTDGVLPYLSHYAQMYVQ